MSETLTGCAAASTDSTSRSTKVPVEITSVRPEPGKIALKAPWDTSPSVHHSSQSTISNGWLRIRRR